MVSAVTVTDCKVAVILQPIGGDQVAGTADTVLDLWLSPQPSEMFNLNFS